MLSRAKNGQNTIRTVSTASFSVISVGLYRDWFRCLLRVVRCIDPPRLLS